MNSTRSRTAFEVSEFHLAKGRFGHDIFLILALFALTAFLGGRLSSAALLQVRTAALCTLGGRVFASRSKVAELEAAIASFMRTIFFEMIFISTKMTLTLWAIRLHVTVFAAIEALAIFSLWRFSAISCLVALLITVVALEPEFVWLTVFTSLRAPEMCVSTRFAFGAPLGVGGCGAVEEMVALSSTCRT